MNVDRRKTGNTHGDMKPRVMVIHATESNDYAGTGDVVGVLKYLERTPDKLGIHFVIDKEGNIGRGARIHQPENMVYHCKGANSFSIGIELVAWTRFSLSTWLQRRRQLRALAWLLAWASQELDIPLRRSTTWGVARHSNFPDSGHSDPGVGFPMRRVLRAARWNVARAARGETYGWNTPLTFS